MERKSVVAVRSGVKVLVEPGLLCHGNLQVVQILCWKDQVVAQVEAMEIHDWMEAARPDCSSWGDCQKGGQ